LFFFQAEDGIRDFHVTGVQTCALPISKVEDLVIPGPAGALPARYYEAADAGSAPLIVFFHGGGFVCCDIDTHDSICSWLAKSSRSEERRVGKEGEAGGGGDE